ncbi:MAG TPA: TetR/AcrR family transcriptional regulator [Pseudogracilibacillus sp.]|nr:TetR/AcrR family transcriptional regulator [Pseudogracilibacillus sp.]
MAKDVEQTIIDAAIRLFSEKGYAATSIRDIANSIDMTSASLYYYIKNKKDLLNLIMNRYLTLLIDNANETIATVGDDDPSDKLKALISNHVQNHGSNKLAALVVDTEYRSLEGEHKAHVKKLRSEYEQIWFKVLEEGKAEGIFSYDNAKITSFAMINLCTGVAHWYREDGTLSIQDIAEEYTMLGLKMVLA